MSKNNLPSPTINRGSCVPNPTPFAPKNNKVHPLDVLTQVQWDKLRESVDWSRGQSATTRISALSRVAIAQIYWVLFGGNLHVGNYTPDSEMSLEAITRVIEATHSLIEIQREEAKDKGVDYSKTSEGITAISNYYQNLVLGL